MSYNIKLDVFEGPFDLLFHLIDKNEVDIYDIPIAKITQQYLEYLASMKALDLEIASEFLVMAATLLSIKARTLLPKPPKEDAEEEEFYIDPRDELVERLLEYKKFKAVAEQLRALEGIHEQTYSRPNELEMYEHLFTEANPLEGVTLNDLMKALNSVLERVDQEEDIPKELPREEYSIRDKMREIVRRLVFHPNGLKFNELFVRRLNSRVEIVVTFLALLELIKLRKVAVHQSRLFGDIIIYSRRENIVENEVAVAGESE